MPSGYGCSKRFWMGFSPPKRRAELWSAYLAARRVEIEMAPPIRRLLQFMEGLDLKFWVEQTPLREARPKDDQQRHGRVGMDGQKDRLPIGVAKGIAPAGPMCEVIASRPSHKPQADAGFLQAQGQFTMLIDVQPLVETAAFDEAVSIDRKIAAAGGRPGDGAIEAWIAKSLDFQLGETPRTRAGIDAALGAPVDGAEVVQHLFHAHTHALAFAGGAPTQGLAMLRLWRAGLWIEQHSRAAQVENVSPAHDLGVFRMKLGMVRQ